MKLSLAPIKNVIGPKGEAPSIKFRGRGGLKCDRLQVQNIDYSRFIKYGLSYM